MSRMLRAVRHLREAATKYSFSLSIESLKIHLDEPATIVLDLSRGPRRVRGSAAIEAAKGDNELSLHIPLHCNATLFKPKSSTQGGLTRKRNKQQPDAAANADDAIVASSDPDAFQPKEAKLQVIELSRQRRLGGRLLSRVRPSPSTSLASVLPRDPSASGSVIVSPEAGVDAREAGAVVAEAVFDLAGLVAAQKAGTQRVHLPLTKAKGSLTMSFSCTKLEANVAEVLHSPVKTAKAASASVSTPAAGVTSQPLVLCVPQTATLPSSSETSTALNQTFGQQQNGQKATVEAGIPLNTQEGQTKGLQEDLQQRAELRRKDELIASLQRQVALMEAEDRQAAAPQLAQLFAQIDELHTALAAAQEQQLATVQAEKDGMQLLANTYKVVEAGETREALRASKDQTIADLTKALQEMQHKQGQTQTLHQQALQKLNSYRDEAEALREKIRCQEETLQRLPTQAACFVCVFQSCRLRELMQEDLVHAKVELAAAEQRRHEDIDAFKKKLQMVKDTVVAYAVASSSNVQAQPTVQSDQNKSNVSSRTSSINGKGSPVRKLVHISSLKAFFRSNVNPSSNSSNSYPVVSRSAGDSSTLATAAKASSLTNCEDPCIRATPPETRGYKGPPAPVTLFGSQPQPGAPVGPSVTRFCASSGGGCSVLTSSEP
ncbi:pseudouridylate synthase [Cyclospora cayetanensis]|uniref:Pseudouridylate synthase n=1 Tax=Cyclospora cayetanensis TaxID=88456 RepID=A0A1D3CXV0_9EIME|nr:pseudouridylate synthase [Cyclospora cayetanensis]